MDYAADFNVFVGTKLGLFKGVKLEIKDEKWRGISKNLNNVEKLKQGEEITALVWGDEDQRDVLIGYADRSVKVYNSESGEFLSHLDINAGEGKICGIGQCNKTVVVAVTSGHVCLQHEEKQHIVKIPGSLEKLKMNPKDSNIFAVGGKETDLQVWDIENKTPTFKAKNVRHDSLELRVPVWISDLNFFPNSENIATISRYGHIRIYDPRGPKRRPVFNFEVRERSLTACGITNAGNHIVFGSGTGHMGAVDIRASLLSHTYKGASGSVRGLAVHPTEPFIFTVGFDRFLRVHHFEKRSLLYSDFMFAKCNSVLVRDDFFYQPAPTEKESQEVVSDIEAVNLSDEEKPESIERKDYHKLFDQMEAIVEEPKRKRMRKKT